MSDYTRLTQGYGQPLKKGFRGFADNKYVAGTKQFLQSNSLVAKVAFLILVVIVFVLLLRLGTSIITWIFTPSSDPKLVNGMKDATVMQIVSQNPSVSGAKPVLRSINQQDGIEFTYSVWLFIEIALGMAGLLYCGGQSGRHFRLFRWLTVGELEVNSRCQPK